MRRTMSAVIVTGVCAILFISFCIIAFVSLIFVPFTDNKDGDVQVCPSTNLIASEETLLDDQIEMPDSPFALGLAASNFFNQFPSGDQVEKKKIAGLIISIGEKRGFTRRSIEVAVATAIQETKLENLPGGDRDSLGVFQQRPSQDWGTPEQIMDPVYATNAFYSALAQVEDRDQLPLKEAAIAVQHPDSTYYNRDWAWDEIARDIVSSSLGESSGIDEVIEKNQRSCVDESSEFIAHDSDNNDSWQSPLSIDAYSYGSPYGYRSNPFGGTSEFHNGVDLIAPSGTPIYAATGGTVTSTDAQPTGGNVTWIDNGNGYILGYAHQSYRAPAIKNGAKVEAGDLIGYVGSTGASTGAHLHFYIMLSSNGIDTVDPDLFMRDHGVILKK